MDKAKEISKSCVKCGDDLALSMFYKKKSGKFGVDATCKICTSKLRNMYYTINREDILKQKSQYKTENKDKIQEYQHNYVILNKDKCVTTGKKYYIDNKIDILQKMQAYYVVNKEEILTQHAKYKYNKRRTDPFFKLNDNIRSLISNTFRKKKIKKNDKSEQILGCTFEEFKIHLEKQFDVKMSWDNQGTYWHMDHIKPISLATNERELIELNHYTNFQPLEKYENIKKRNKYEK